MSGIDHQKRTKVKESVICLVGSVKQESDWRRWTAELTKRGYVVLEAGLYGTVGKDITQETWDLVSELHFKKLDMASVIGVINKPDGSVGEDTQKDIDHARTRGKVIIPVGFIGESFP